MDSYKSTCELSKHSEIFHKFDKYDLSSIPIILCDFTMVFFINFIRIFLVLVFKMNLEYSTFDLNVCT